MEEQSRTVVKYLNSLGKHIRAVDACIITLGGEERPAARYTQHNTPPPGARNPAPYESTRFYVLGELPAVVIKTPGRRDGGSGICFPYAGDDWYVGGGYTNHLLKPFGKATGAPEFAKQNPLGEWFSIDRWSIAGERIDHYETRPYRRVPLSVRYL